MSVQDKKYSKGGAGIKGLVLLVFIAFCGTLIYLRLQINGSENSKFNQTTRFRLGKYAWLRKVFGLHNDGDARAWFLSGHGTLVVEIARAKNIEVNEKALAEFVKLAEIYTGLKAVVFNEETFHSGKLTDQDLEDIVLAHRRHEISSNPNLFIIYAEDFNRQGTEVGSTFKEYGMVLSDKRLKEVTQKSPEALPQYIESTMLHEFGHQLGLPHNQEPGCIMNEKAEKPDENGIFDHNYTQTDFCEFEKNQLEQIKEKLNN